MKKNILTISKSTRSMIFTYALVIVAFVVIQLLRAFKDGGVGSVLEGQLIPICAYVTMALALNLVVGISGELSLGHAGFMSIGAFMGCAAASSLAGVLLAMVVCTILGMVIERLAYKPLRQAPSLAVLITAIGVSYFLQNSALLLWTSNPKSFSSVVGTGSIKLLDGQLTITHVALVTVAACIVIMLGLTWFTGHTRMGKAMRACSEDKAAAQLMGINVNSTISMTFAIGSALAAIAGVLPVSYTHLDVYKRQGQGFKIAMMTLDGGRIGIAAQALGLGEGAVDEAVKYTKERVQFGRRISQFQNTQFQLADMHTRMQAAQYLVYSAAMKKQNHEPYSMDAAMASWNWVFWNRCV